MQVQGSFQHKRRSVSISLSLHCEKSTTAVDGRPLPAVTLLCIIFFWFFFFSGLSQGGSRCSRHPTIRRLCPPPLSSVESWTRSTWHVWLGILSNIILVLDGLDGCNISACLHMHVHALYIHYPHVWNGINWTALMSGGCVRHLQTTLVA